ncbi:MAG: hypothetical protein IKF78_10240 [Atopobiaceae bacterium]|nr:hypothetical protein [Atopobiaceae bacterium]
MDGETNGGQQETQAQQEAKADGQEGQQREAQDQQEVGGSAGNDYEQQIAERDKRISELEAQVAEAAKNAETAEQLRGEIAEFRQASADARIDFKLQLAGCRNVKAARAILSDHGDDVDKLKEAEPWLFSAGGGNRAAQGGTTGLPNAGAAIDTEKTLRHWREVAGLTDRDEKKE